MKRLFLIIVQIFLIIIFAYVSNIINIPNSVILFDNEQLNMRTLAGLDFVAQDGKTILTNKNLSEELENNEKLSLKLFNMFPIKNVDVNIIPNTTVVPLGNVIGLKLYTDGVLVVGVTEVENVDNKKVKPYENSNIDEGDMIIAVNNKAITNTAELVQEVNKSDGKSLELKYVRNGEILTSSITPEKVEDNQYKLGIWVRDSAAGVGTISFYEPSTGMFAALGHGIMDVDTGDLITIARGSIVTSNIVSIQKGEKGKPGEIRGSIVNQSVIGEISKNTKLGIFGKLSNLGALNINTSNAIPVASRDEIELGKAKIVCMLENNKKEEYDVEIQKVFLNNNEDNKSMVIKITDSRLLAQTGGIIQGMSGSPIIQNGKLIGVVTHVFVSDPTMGYGVFSDLMIQKMRE